MSKHAKLLSLARKRKSARWPHVRQVGSYHGGAYDSDHVSPYTKSAGNVDADVFLLLQDWSSDSWLSKPLNLEVQRLGYAPSLPTNRNLGSLLRTHLDLHLADTYATNLFPFIKQGTLSSRLAAKALYRAAREYAIPQIRIVSPKLVVCLGLATVNAIREGCRQPATSTLEAAIAEPFSIDGVMYWAQAHPGHFGQLGRNKGCAGQVGKDWQRMGEWLREQAS